jgi:hypothetical protein
MDLFQPSGAGHPLRPNPNRWTTQSTEQCSINRTGQVSNSKLNSGQYSKWNTSSLKPFRTDRKQCYRNVGVDYYTELNQVRFQ